MKPNIDVFLIVDHSSSTQAIIGNINTAISNMIGRLRTSPYLSGINVYLTFIQFNHRYEILTQCELIDRIDPSRLAIASSGATDPGPAILKAIEIGSARYEQWRAEGEESFHPLYYFFTDGYPDAGKGATQEEIDAVDAAYAAACNSVRDLELNHKALFIAAGFQSERAMANMERLRQLTIRPDHIVCISNNDVGMLERFFSELIPRTVTGTITRTQAQIDGAFNIFNQ